MAPATSDHAASFMREAAAIAGGDEWGDLGFLPSLELLLESSMSRLTAFGREVLGRVVVRRLVNRLHVQAYVGAHPDTATRPLAVAAVVTGLPRTGTTVLQNLLALDPSHRVLRLWEALHPVPPDPARGFGHDELVRQAERWLARMYELVPGFRAIHPGTADGPEECDALLQNEFASQHFDDMLDAEAYSTWLYHARLSRQYRYYGLQLRVLSGPEQSRAWVLKSPSHLAHLDALLATVPDALVVHCHRHPNEAVASWASLIRAVRSPYYEHVPPAVVGRQALDRASTAVARALRTRQQYRSDRILDIPYRLILHRPLDAARLVYDRMGRTLGPDVESTMAHWLAAHPQHRYGPHRYGLADFSLGTNDVESRFSSYLSTFADLVT